MPDHTNSPEAVAKMLKAFDSHSVKDNWKKHRKIDELEYYQCEITWLSKSHAVDLAKFRVHSLMVQLHMGPLEITHFISTCGLCGGESKFITPKYVNWLFQLML